MTVLRFKNSHHRGWWWIMYVFDESFDGPDVHPSGLRWYGPFGKCSMFSRPSGSSLWSPHSKSDDSKKSQNRLEAVLTLLGGDYCGMVLGNTLSPLYNARRSHLNNNDYQLSQRATWGRVWYMYGIVHRKGIHLWRKQLYSCPLAGYLKVLVMHGIAFFTTVAMTYTVRDDYPSYKEVIKNMWTMLSHTFLFGIKKWWMICLCFCPQNGVYRWLTQNWLISGLIQTKGLWNRPFRGPLGGPDRIGNWLFCYPKRVIFVGEKSIPKPQKRIRVRVRVNKAEVKKL